MVRGCMSGVKLDFTNVDRKACKRTYIGHRPLGSGVRKSETIACRKPSGFRMAVDPNAAVLKTGRSSGKGYRVSAKAVGIATYREAVGNSSEISIPATAEIETPAQKEARLRLHRKEQQRKRLNKFNLEDEDEDDIIILKNGQRATRIHPSDLDILRDDFSDDDDAQDETDSDDEKVIEQITKDNFGQGGILSTDGQPPVKRSRKEIFDEIISKSKKAKAESSRDKIQQRFLLDELDKTFNQIAPELDFRTAPVDKNDASDSQLNKFSQIVQTLNSEQTNFNGSLHQDNDYDQLTALLKQDIVKAKTGCATDRLKTPEEIAWESQTKRHNALDNILKKSNQTNPNALSESDSETADSDSETADSDSETAAGNSSDNDGEAESDAGGNETAIDNTETETGTDKSENDNSENGMDNTGGESHSASDKEEDSLSIRTSAKEVNESGLEEYTAEMLMKKAIENMCPVSALSSSLLSCSLSVLLTGYVVGSSGWSKEDREKVWYELILGRLTEDEYGLYEVVFGLVGGLIDSISPDDQEDKTMVSDRSYLTKSNVSKRVWYKLWCELQQDKSSKLAAEWWEVFGRLYLSGGNEMERYMNRLKVYEGLGWLLVCYRELNKEYVVVAEDMLDSLCGLMSHDVRGVWGLMVWCHEPGVRGGLKSEVTPTTSVDNVPFEDEFENRPTKEQKRNHELLVRSMETLMNIVDKKYSLELVQLSVGYLLLALRKEYCKTFTFDQFKAVIDEILVPYVRRIIEQTHAGYVLIGQWIVPLKQEMFRLSSSSSSCSGQTDEVNDRRLHVLLDVCETFIENICSKRIPPLTLLKRDFPVGVQRLQPIFIDIREEKFYELSIQLRGNNNIVRTRTQKSVLNSQRRQIIKQIKSHSKTLQNIQTSQTNLRHYHRDRQLKKFEHNLQTEIADINKLKSTSYLPTTKKNRQQQQPK